MIVGRWIAVNGDDKERAIDIGRCGQLWCGVEVDKDGKCGRVALHLILANGEKGGDVQFTGQYSAVDGTEPYVIGATVMQEKQGLTLYAYGHTGGQFLAFRRSYPFHMMLSREGDAVCKTEEKVSSVER